MLSKSSREFFSLFLFPFKRLHLCGGLLELLVDLGAGQVGGQALLELVGLVRVLQDQGVQVALAADLELGLASLVLLDAGICGC